MSTTNDSRVPAGVPTGGQFAATQRQEAAVTLPVPAPQRTVRYEDLQSGDVIIGDNGTGRLDVFEATPSSSMPGFIAVETNFGFLYVAADETCTVAAEDEKYVTFTANTATEADVEYALEIARNKFGYAGSLWQRGDFETVLDEMVEDRELPDETQLWEHVRDSRLWRDLGEPTDGDWDAIREAITNAAAELTK